MHHAASVAAHACRHAHSLYQNTTTRTSPRRSTNALFAPIAWKLGSSRHARRCAQPARSPSTIATIWLLKRSGGSRRRRELTSLKSTDSKKSAARACCIFHPCRSSRSATSPVCRRRRCRTSRIGGCVRRRASSAYCTPCLLRSTGSCGGACAIKKARESTDELAYPAHLVGQIAARCYGDRRCLRI